MDHDLLANITYSLCYLKGVYNNMKFRVFIDTGAQVSVISSSMLPALQLETKVNKSYVGKAHGVGQSNILGKIIGLEISIGGMIFINNYSVLESNEQLVLLGMDFLTHYECELSIKNRSIMIDSQKLTFLNEGEIDELEIPVLEPLVTPLIQKIIQNILFHPKEDKFKRINRKHLNNMEEQYLIRLGFLEANEKLVFCDNVALLSDALVC